MENWKKNLVICWIGAFVSSIGLSQIAPFLPLYIGQLGVHSQGSIEIYTGLCYGVTFLVGGLLSPFWAKVSDKHGRKLILLRASLGIGLVIFLTAFVTNVYELIALRTIQGFVTGYITACNVLLTSQTDEAHIGRVMGIFATAGVSGGVIGPIVGGILYNLVGIRIDFMIIGVLLILVFILSLVFIEEKNFEPILHKSDGLFSIIKEVSNIKFLLVLFIIGFLFRSTRFAISPMITEYTEVLNITGNISIIVGIVFSIFSISKIISSPILGKIIDKVGTKNVLMFSVLTIAILYLPEAYVTNIYELIILRFLIGLAVGGIVPAINSSIKRSTNKEHTVRIMGLNMMFQYFGMFLGAVFGGQIGDMFGIRYVFIISSIVLIICCILIYFSIYRNSKIKI